MDSGEIGSSKGGARENYNELLLDMREVIEHQNGALVLFHPDSPISELPPLGDLTKGLVWAYSTEDGIICVDSDNFDTWSESHHEVLPQCPLSWEEVRSRDHVATGF